MPAAQRSQQVSQWRAVHSDELELSMPHTSHCELGLDLSRVTWLG